MKIDFTPFQERLKGVTISKNLGGYLQNPDNILLKDYFLSGLNQLMLLLKTVK